MLRNYSLTFEMLNPKSILPVLLGVLLLYSCSKNKSDSGTPNPPPPPPPPPVTHEWKFDSLILWSDEFSIDGTVDFNKWGYDVGGNGWGNNELEYYTSGLNDSVKNGALYIIARKENYLGRIYTSARIVSKNKGDWTYGRFEIKAKLPKGRGTWPAIWMLPTDNIYGIWPRSGEIDIMEHVGFDLNNVHFTLHANAFYGANGKGGSKILTDATDAFHRYRLDWAPYGIRGFIDDDMIFEYLNPGLAFDTWPYDKKFHLLMNVAIGGSWGGAQGVDDSIFPVMLQIDYARVYKFEK
jgi:beta-glucanase (GH16 family)